MSTSSVWQVAACIAADQEAQRKSDGADLGPVDGNGPSPWVRSVSQYAQRESNSQSWPRTRAC